MPLRFKSAVTNTGEVILPPEPGAPTEGTIYPEPMIAILTGQVATVTGGPLPDSYTVTNYATPALLADFSAVAPASYVLDISVPGPYGVDVTVTPVTFSGTAKYGNVIGGAVATFLTATAIEGSVWVYNTTAGFVYLNVTVSTSTPTATATIPTVIAPGIWQRIHGKLTGTFTASTTLEFNLAKPNTGNALVYVWKDSVMLEDYSTPWEGLHELHTVSDQAADGPLTSYSREIPNIMWCGDSISYGCCAAEIPAGMYPFPRALMQRLEGTWDAAGAASANGRKTGSFAVGTTSVFYTASQGTNPTIPASSLDRPTIFWIGTNDTGSYETAAYSFNQLKLAIAYLTSRGNYKYAIALPLFRTQGYEYSHMPPSGANYLDMLEFHRLIRTDSITSGHVIDIAGHTGYNFTEVSPGVYADTEGNYSDGLHLTVQGYMEMCYPFFLQRLQEMGWFNR